MVSSEKKNWLSVLAFFIVLAMILALLSAVFNVKSVDTWPSSRVTCGFYQEPEGTLDVIYLGTSHIMCGISPMRIWQQQGITGYSLATERQYMGLTYFWLQEALKYQSPGLVVLDAMTLFAWPFSDFESRQRKALDYMKMSSVKRDAIKAVCDYSADADPLTYYIPFVAYHDRWSMLTESDFSFPFEDKKNLDKGFYMCYEGVGTEFTEPFYSSEGQLDPLSQATLDYFHLIRQLCADNGIRLLLVQMPRSEEWSMEKHDLVTEMAENYGFDFLDLGTDQALEEMDFDPVVDMYDPWHVSSYGADKVSALLGSYIAANYDFPAHSQQTTDQWNADMELFDQRAAEDAVFRVAERQRLAEEAEAAARAAALEDLRD